MGGDVQEHYYSGYPDVAIEGGDGTGNAKAYFEEWRESNRLRTGRRGGRGKDIALLKKGAIVYIGNARVSEERVNIPACS